MAAIPLNTLIRPAVDHIATTYGASGGAPAMAMMAAIGLQESGFEARDQLEVQNGRLVPGAIGPATGFWQFERGGGVAGVMRHPASRSAAQDLAAAGGVPFDADAIWRHFATIEGDELAAAFARLLLLTDPRPLPAPEAVNEEEAWQYYLRNWRPGKPHRQTWGGYWAAACAAVAGQPAVPAVPRPTAPVAPAVVPGGADPALAARVAALEDIITKLRAALR
jgi:hypothetical protein